MSQQNSPSKSYSVGGGAGAGAGAPAQEHNVDEHNVLSALNEAIQDDDEYGSEEEGHEEEDESDSELDNEIEIDDVGNVIQEAAPLTRPATSTLQNLLAGYGTEVVDSIVQGFLNYGIEQEELSSLTAEDLAMLQVNDKTMIDTMLKEFADMPNQKDHYDSATANMDPASYNHMVFNNVFQHLITIQSSLQAAKLKIQINPPENTLVNDTTYSSELVLKTLDEISRNANIMEKRIAEHKYFTERKKRVEAAAAAAAATAAANAAEAADKITNEESAKARRKILKVLVLIGSVSLGTVLLFKYYKPSVFNRFRNAI